MSAFATAVDEAPHLLLVNLTPPEHDALQRLRGSISADAYVTDLLSRLVAGRKAMRRRVLGEQRHVGATGSMTFQVAVQVPPGLWSDFGVWRGKALPDAEAAVRAAIRLAAAELPRVPRTGTPPTIESASPDATSREARRPVKPNPPPVHKPPSPSRRAQPRPVKSMPSPTSPRPRPTPHRVALESLRRHVQRGRTPRAGKPPRPPLGGYPRAEVVNASARATARTFEALWREPAKFVLAPEWTDEVELEVGRLIAHSDGGRLPRILIGVVLEEEGLDDQPVDADDEDFEEEDCEDEGDEDDIRFMVVGVADPGAVTERFEALVTTLTRTGSFTATVHRVRELTVWVVELEVRVSTW